MPQSVYEMSDEDLVDAFRKASFRANSSGAFDCMASSYASTVWYLQGVLLSRLKGLTPPFRCGDIVKNTSKFEVRPVDFNGEYIMPDSCKTIKKIHYDCKSNKWLLEFSNDSVYEASKFTLESSSIVVAKA